MLLSESLDDALVRGRLLEALEDSLAIGSSLEEELLPSEESNLVWRAALAAIEDLEETRLTTFTSSSELEDLVELCLLLAPLEYRLECLLDRLLDTLEMVLSGEVSELELLAASKRESSDEYSPLDTAAEDFPDALDFDSPVDFLDALLSVLLGDLVEDLVDDLVDALLKVPDLELVSLSLETLV